MQGPRQDTPYITDALIFAATNLWVYLRHPLLALNSCLRLGRLVNFARPERHGDMIQWRKVFDRNPAFITLADKLAAKRWACSVCPDLLTAEVLWEGDDPDLLPEALISPGHVIKGNNGCAQNYLPDRGIWPRHVFRRRARRWLGRRWARLGEWAYGQVPPRLFVERLVAEGRPLTELTFRAFDGTVALAFVATCWKTDAARAAYLDNRGHRLELAVAGAAPLREDFVLPAAVFARARRHAERLSRGLDHVRVDFLVDGDEVYFGEATLYSASGYGDEDRLGLGQLLVEHWYEAMGSCDFLAQAQRGPARFYQAAFRRWVEQRRAVEVNGVAIAGPVDR